MPIFVLISLFVVGCSSINQQERAYYEEKKHSKHGIVEVHPNVTKVPVSKRLEADIVKIGEGLYNRDCLRCHGVAGEGDGVDAKNQIRPPMDLKETVRQMKHFDFYVQISQMDGTMPGWSRPYTDEERAAIVAYLKTL